MELISQQEFEELAQFTNEVCVSIFIPTQRAGKDVLEEKSRIHLKSKWNEVKRQLEKNGITADKIEKIGEPIVKLLQDKNFWRHQSDGLAVYSAEGFFQKHSLPLKFDAYHYISKEFYVKPLVAIFSGDGRFYLLALQLEDVTLYEATKHSIGVVYVEDLIPTRLQERVGFDYKEKALQFRPQQQSNGQSAYHGHGGADDNRKSEIFRYFRAIDQGLDTIIHDENVPLVVACQDSLFPIYKEANTYKNLYEEDVSGNPSDTDMLGLHDKAWNLIESYFEKTKMGKLKKFEELNQTEKTSASVHDIFPAIIQGKVEALFLDNKEEIWGIYNEDTMAVEVQDEQSPKNTSLMNLAAKAVIEHGGSVFLIEPEAMPEKSSKMNALYRFS
jgi:hypothetical protein